MNRNRIFFSFASILGIIAVFILWIPSLVTPDLIQPLRIDSVYMEFQRQQAFANHPENFNAIDSTIFFNPEDLNIEYSNFDVKTSDNKILRGWYIASADSNSNTILILHDWNESKIQKLNLAKQMHDRGFNVCLVDLRAHGNSDGVIFSPGIGSISDVKCILDSLLSNSKTNRVAILGSGISAGIALQSALFDGRADAIVLQCPFNSYKELVIKYSEKKWGATSFILFPVLKRKLEKIIKTPIENLHLANFSKLVDTPTLLIAAGDDSFYPPIDAYAIFDSSAAVKKNIYLVKKSTHETIEMVGGDQYYNAIAEFISLAIPKKVIKTRNKKMT